MEQKTGKFLSVVSVVIFGVFFGLLEAIVVTYLRQIFDSTIYPVPHPGLRSDVFLNLGFIAFLKSSTSVFPTIEKTIIRLELLREGATILMLLSLAIAVGKTLKERFGFFLLAFSVWDLFYYVFLKFIIDWPKTLFDIDIFFLLPVAWIGPVITAIVISIVLFIISLFLLFQTDKF